MCNINGTNPTLPSPAAAEGWFHHLLWTVHKTQPNTEAGHQPLHESALFLLKGSGPCSDVKLLSRDAFGCCLSMLAY